MMSYFFTADSGGEHQVPERDRGRYHHAAGRRGEQRESRLRPLQGGHRQIDQMVGQMHTGDGTFLVLLLISVVAILVVVVLTIIKLVPLS